jgi:prophage regulatory protein
MSQGHASQPQDHFIRLQEVLFRVGISRSQVYKLMDAGQFPAQIKIGYSSLWSHHAVNHWMATQIALSESSSKSQEVTHGNQ